jgi:hypothetical protein
MAIKVKQSTIDEIKKMGMTKALAAAKTRRTPEYQEAVKRMYGAKRLAKATAGTGRSTQPVGGVMGSKRAQVMAGPVRSTTKKTVAKSMRSQVGRGAAAAGAAAYATAVYKQSKNPTKGIVTGRTRGANVAGKAQRSAYKAAIKSGKTSAQATTAAKAAKLGKAGMTAGKFLTKRTVLGSAALYAGEKLVSKAMRDSKKPKARPGVSRKKSSGGKGY